MAPIQVCSWQPLTEESRESNRAGGTTVLLVENASASGRQEGHPLGRELCRQRASRAPRGTRQARVRARPPQRSTAGAGAVHPEERRSCRGGGESPTCPCSCALRLQNPGDTEAHRLRPFVASCTLAGSRAFFKRCLRIIQLFSQARRR